MWSLTRRCFQIFFIFTPNLGEDEPIFDDHIFQRGWFNHQPVKLSPHPPMFLQEPDSSSESPEMELLEELPPPETAQLGPDGEAHGEGPV